MPTGPIVWRGRTVWVGGAGSGRGRVGRVVRYAKGFMHDIICMVRLARKERYDIVQVRNKFIVGSLASIIARARGLRFVFWLSFPVPEAQLAQAESGTASFPIVNRLRGRVFGWLLYRVILPRCDHAFVQSERMKQDLCAKGADPRKLTPVPMGIDLDEWPDEESLSRPVSGTGRQLIVGYLGTLGAQRRLEILIDAIAMIVNQGVDAKLLIVGGSERPDDHAQLKNRAQQLGVADRVEITGLLPRAEALARFREVDVALSPFFPTPVLQSTSPTKLVEYMALGIPIVANIHPEQQVILQQSRAGLCVPWRARHFARACIWLARAGRQRRADIGQRGRDWVIENRSYGSIAESVEATYLDILGRTERCLMELCSIATARLHSKMLRLVN